MSTWNIHGTNFMVSEHELDNLWANTPKGEKVKVTNAITRETRTITGTGTGSHVPKRSEVGD